MESADVVLARDHNGARILIVDDEAVNRMLIQDILQVMQPEIDMAENGKVAVDLASKNTYDLILMDMQMPQMNGLDAAREIRKLGNGINVPIIALSGNAFGDDKSHCLEAGMNDFINKPFNMKILFEIILKYLS